MYFLIIQLFKVEYKEDVLLAMTSCGIQKGSAFEGQNLDKVLEREFPLFTGLIRSEDEREQFSILITSVVDSKKRVREFVQLLKEADIDIKRENILRVVMIPSEMIIDHTQQWESQS
ncbi:hypothetical protein JW835_10505 [bacterium]|nr:hypothetical protein [bacterium]